jgi:hypothetical protein
MTMFGSHARVLRADAREGAVIALCPQWRRYAPRSVHHHIRAVKKHLLLAFLLTASFCTYAVAMDPVQGQSSPKAPASGPTQRNEGNLDPEQEKLLIDRVKREWRSATGEKLDEVVARAAEVTHFVPRGWFVHRDIDQSPEVYLIWVRNRKDTDYYARSIIWTARQDGSFEITSPYAKTMELGSTAFTLALAQNEVADGEAKQNMPFLMNIKNLNFVRTPQGALGDVLEKGSCSLDPGSPVYITFMPNGRYDDQRPCFLGQISVKCAMPGPSYFAQEGLVTFRKLDGAADWQPDSLLARRLWKYPPEYWFKATEPDEDQNKDIVRNRIPEASNATTVSRTLPSRPGPRAQLRAGGRQKQNQRSHHGLTEKVTVTHQH